jgi:starch phosphorylase
VLNVSTLDGWWDEVWVSDIQGVRLSPGWAIGRRETFEDREYQDQLEAEAFYDLLEQDLVSTFYDRKADGLPRRWLARMKAAIRGLCPVYNAHRMVKEYVESYYLVAQERHARLSAQGAANARELSAWKDRVRACWPQVRVESVEPPGQSEVSVGGEIKSRAKVHLGALSPDDVAVELYAGRLDTSENITGGLVRLMQAVAREGELHVFETAFGPCPESGRYGYTVRVKPFHRDSDPVLVPGCITWAS